jgi:hypothetical protein
MEIKKFKILIVTLVIVSSFGIINVISIESNENLVSIETDSNMWSFNSSWDNWKCNNDSTGNAISDAYVNSTIGYISGQSKMNETGNGQAKGWMRHSIEWDCPVDNESGEVNISYEYNAFAFLRVNSSGYAHAKLWLTFFIDDIQHEVIIYNNTLDEINESVNFSGHSIENWLKNLTLSNKTYMIGVNASYEIEYTGNDTQSMAWLYFDIPDTTIDESDGNTEYWAVLIGVDYAWCTEFWLHIPFDENAEQMKKMLLVSDHWQEDHIKVLTEEEATWVNIIEALRWLDKKDDGDDVSLVYYSAHGGNFNFEEKWGIKIDLWPWDEEDGYDEYLTTYWSGKRLFAPIWDDLLNSLLDLLDSENVVVIIDACFSGGMIDSDKSSWITEFSGEINNDNKVIVTSCGEQEYSFIDSNDGISFSYFIMEGLQGYADDISEGGNGNGAVSIEEAFEYAEPKYKSLFGDPINPEINDPDEINEIELTDVELPNDPLYFWNIEIGDPITLGQLGTSYMCKVKSIEPEGDTIRYGWNWSKDFFPVPSEYTWGFGEFDSDEWSGYYNSGDFCTMYHEWESHFSTESDMLNEQTFFQVGDDHEELQGYPVGTWRWGTVHCLINWFGLIDYPFEWSVDENKLESRETTWKVDQSGIVSGTVLVGVQVNLTREGQEGEIQVRGWFFTVETSPKKFIGQIGSAPENNIEYAYPQTNDVAVGVISARPYEHDKIDPEEKTIDMSTIIWLWKDIPLPKSVSDYHLHYDENAEEQETLEITPYYWEEACGYLNLTSEELSVDSSVYLGITTIEADITEALCEEGMPIYSFAADRGEMRVKFVC